MDISRKKSTWTNHRTVLVACVNYTRASTGLNNHRGVGTRDSKMCCCNSSYMRAKQIPACLLDVRRTKNSWLSFTSMMVSSLLRSKETLIRSCDVSKVTSKLPACHLCIFWTWTSHAGVMVHLLFTKRPMQKMFYVGSTWLSQSQCTLQWTNICHWIHLTMPHQLLHRTERPSGI